MPKETSVLYLKLGRRFVETMLYWRRYLRAQEVQDFLGVSERTARSLIRGWRIDGIFPPYRAADGRRLIAAPTFTPASSVTDPNVALSLLLVSDRLPGNPFSTFAPRRALMPYVLQELSERLCWRTDGSSVRVWAPVGLPPQRVAEADYAD